MFGTITFPLQCDDDGDDDDDDEWSVQLSCVFLISNAGS